MKAIIALLLLGNASAHRLIKDQARQLPTSHFSAPLGQIDRHEPDFDLSDATYVQHKAEPAGKEDVPDCDKFPNAVGCQIGENATHVNIAKSSAGAVGSAELTDATYGEEKKAGDGKADAAIVKDMKKLMQMQA